MPKDKNIVEEKSEEQGEVKNKEQKKIKQLNEQIEKLKSDVDHWKNEYYRAYADTKNLRNNLEKEHADIVRYRGMGFVEQLLPVLDSFHMALSNEATSDEMKNYLVGFQYIYRNMVAALENEGVSEIAPKVGDKFSSDEMNAVDTVEQEGEENLIVKIYRNGYKLHNRLIRPAMVSVSKNKKEENKDEQNVEQAQA